MQVHLVEFPATAKLVAPQSPRIPLRRRSDAAQLQLINRYASQDGVGLPEEIICRMRPYWKQPLSALAKWIAERRLVSFSWRAQLLVPLFQLMRPTMAPQQAVAECSRGLGELVDDEGFADWFVRPCVWLGNSMPVELLLDEPDAVVRAAELTGSGLRSRRLSDAVPASQRACAS
jgi:hypothetical protein